MEARLKVTDRYGQSLEDSPSKVSQDIELEKTSRNMAWEIAIKVTSTDGGTAYGDAEVPRTNKRQGEPIEGDGVKCSL